MPSYDSSRRRLRLADRHIAVGGHLVSGEEVPAELRESRDELTAAALLGPEQELAPLLAALAAVLAEPLLLAYVEVTGEHGQLNHGIVAGRDIVFAHEAWPGEEESEYTPVEPATLVWALARAVGLVSRPVEDLGLGCIETVMGAVDAAFAVVSRPGLTDLDTAKDHVRKALLDAGGPADPELAALVDILTALNSSWRITTTWSGEDDRPEVRALAVWDCGPYGYWHRQLPSEPIREGEVRPDSVLRIAPVAVGRLWEMIANLLPDDVDEGASARTSGDG